MKYSHLQKLILQNNLKKKRLFHAEIHKRLISFISILDRHILCKKRNTHHQ